MGWPPLAEVDEQHLVAAARTGSAEAWEELVRRFEPLVRRYLTGQLLQPDVAADVTQDVFVAAWVLLHRLRDDDWFVPWLYRIAHHHGRRARRIAGRRRLVSLDQLFDQLGSATSKLRDPTDVADTVAMHDLVQRTLTCLSPALREALLLSAMQGLSAHEVAQHLNISPAAAERRISRAKADFRKRYRAPPKEITECLPFSLGHPPVSR